LGSSLVGHILVVRRSSWRSDGPVGPQTRLSLTSNSVGTHFFDQGGRAQADIRKIISGQKMLFGRGLDAKMTRGSHR